MDRAEAHKLASEQLLEVEHAGYGVASEHIDQVILREVAGPSGTDYELELSYLWDDQEHEDILVICRVKAKTWFERGHIERSVKLSSRAAKATAGTAAAKTPYSPGGEA